MCVLCIMHVASSLIDLFQFWNGWLTWALCGLVSLIHMVLSELFHFPFIHHSTSELFTSLVCMLKRSLSMNIRIQIVQLLTKMVYRYSTPF